MTVKQLIELLQKENPDRVVILSKDSEGNGFSELENVNSNYNYNDGEIGLGTLTPELEKQGYTEEDILDGQPAVVLWP